MIKNFKNHQAFTLIEVLISIALIGIVLVSTMGLFSNALQTNKHSKTLMESTILAKDIMENIKQAFDLLPAHNRNVHSLTKISNEMQKRYVHSRIGICQKGFNSLDSHLYTIKVEVPGIREGSVESFASQIYLP